ncbi:MULTISPECIES: hypothetical protein [Bradyrhizobium]|uniref:Uncharacterized protein n=1 Tax=Bradyrhizobium elkanii TaxID=29448 RepID=A0A8I1YBU1_BRAEL|nr:MULTISPECIES: hypothetical protein [Bradyrhizobium]MBP1297016.1 hypothetical protein [Bradyrhizobium elkanii]QOZ17963.1 hypothetical protein XI02_25220 [Bradyrhizobium sp. CCBAU 21365]WLB04147.1 hypothetical protein QNJ80_20040 [Bradyrhizobium elkanii]
MTATTIEAPALTAQQLADQIVTALEGGSNHWLERFHSKKGKERATEGPWYSDPKVWDGDFEIEVLADEDSVTHSFTPDKVKDGLAWLMKNHPHRVAEIIEETGDAETADVFLQACVLGEIVYG